MLGWHVPDLASELRGVVGRGAVAMDRDDLGIWTTPDGDLVAWFKDPDGNTPSLDRYARTV